jgi:hypothetical protein
MTKKAAIILAQLLKSAKIQNQNLCFQFFVFLF